RNNDLKGARFLIASRFPTPSLACEFFDPRATVNYRLNPRYAIKECSSCGNLYTRDCSCSKGSVEDKILVSKPPKNYARCGHSVNGPYCQECTLLREKLEEDLVTYFQNFQNTSESSNGSTNVVNAPQEPFVVKHDHGVNPPHIDKCCCECGEALDGIISQQCACKSCGKGAHIGYNCPPKVPIISNPEPKFNRYSFFETPTVLLLAWDRVSEIKDAFENKQYKPEDVQELFRILLDDLQNIHEELAEFINSSGWNRPAFYDDDDDDVDYTIAITPVLSIEVPDNSLSMRDRHLDTIPATESNKVIKSSVEDLIPIPSEFKGILDTMCYVHLVNKPTPHEAKDHFKIVINSNDDISSSDDDSLYYENIEYVEASPYDSELVSLEVEKIVIPEDEEIEDDNLREKLLKVNLLIAEIEALKDNPTLSSEFLTKSSSTSSKSILEGTNTFHNSLPEFENFCFDLEEISSGSITTQSDFTHEEFGDEPAHIISPPKYECFYFGNLPDPGELTYSLNSGICENLSSTTCVNLPVEDDYSPFLAYVVWIFLAYLTYPIIPPHLYSFGNEDTIFDPCITINRSYSFKPGLSHRCGTFKKFNTHRSHLNESPMEMLFFTLSPIDQTYMGELGQAQRPKTSASWEAPHAYHYF
nr:hypothetical protein [Tanacetum cinerariifolium]